VTAIFEAGFESTRKGFKRTPDQLAGHLAKAWAFPEGCDQPLGLLRPNVAVSQI